MTTKATAATTKEQLHQLIDQLDDARAEAMLVLLTPPNGASNGNKRSMETNSSRSTHQPLLEELKATHHDDPLWGIVGIGSSPEPTDIANHKDEYVADAIEGNWE